MRFMPSRCGWAVCIFPNRCELWGSDMRRQLVPDECDLRSANPETSILGGRLWTSTVDRTLNFAMLKLYE